MSGRGPRQPSSPAPLEPQHLTFNDVQDQAWVLIGMEEDHVTQRAICECWAQHRDVVLGKSKTGEQLELRALQGQSGSTPSSLPDSGQGA